jgi:hypothetical protein
MTLPVNSFENQMSIPNKQSASLFNGKNSKVVTVIIMHNLRKIGIRTKEWFGTTSGITLQVA